METIFVVQHVHEIEKDIEDVKFIGVYSSLNNANMAVERLKAQPGFCDLPGGFHIDEYSLDKDHWSEGFITKSVQV